MNPGNKDKDFSNKEFLGHSRKLLDDSVDSLDASTLSRLNQARQKALNSRSMDTRRSNFFLTAPAGAVFTSFVVAAVVVLLWTALPQQQPQPQLAQQYEDIEMLTADAEFDLLEDLEFVSWLVEENLDLQVELNDAG
jgi:hypothetical protein